MPRIRDVKRRRVGAFPALFFLFRFSPTAGSSIEGSTYSHGELEPDTLYEDSHLQYLASTQQREHCSRIYKNCRRKPHIRVHSPLRTKIFYTISSLQRGGFRVTKSRRFSASRPMCFSLPISYLSKDERLGDLLGVTTKLQSSTISFWVIQRERTGAVVSLGTVLALSQLSHMFSRLLPHFWVDCLASSWRDYHTGGRKLQGRKREHM